MNRVSRSRLGRPTRVGPWLVIVLLLGAVLVTGAASPAPRPNLVFLLADDLRWDAVGFAGRLPVATPNLDRLAREGTVFRRAYVTTSICAVSRASLFSGQYARRHGIHDFATAFSPEAWAGGYPALLRNAGYRTGFIGKFGVGNVAPTNTFDYWDGFNGQGRYFENPDSPHLTRRLGDSARRFLDQGDARPFCLSISFKAPHAQDGAPREFPPDPADAGLYSEWDPPAAPSVDERAYAGLPEFLRNSEGRARWTRRFASPDQRAATIRDYGRLITGLDREIGRLRERLVELGLADRTVILFTSDNGFFFGEHGLADKWLMYEESIRVPLVIHDPRPRRPASFVEVPVLNLDIAPTLLDYAGLSVPARMQGRSLRPWAEGRRVAGWRRDWFYEHLFEYQGKIPRSEGVHAGRWKYVRYVDQEPVSEQLFDLRRDPYEQVNLAGRPEAARRLDALRRRWNDLRDEAR